MAFNFPNSPTLNDVYTSGTTSYQWNGSAWVLYTTGANAFISASKLTAKGALIVGSAANTPETLPLGTNGYTLIVDTSQTTGVRWDERDSQLHSLLSVGT
jgi:hypothetical protein